MRHVWPWIRLNGVEVSSYYVYQALRHAKVYSSHCPRDEYVEVVTYALYSCSWSVISFCYHNFRGSGTYGDNRSVVYRNCLFLDIHLLLLKLKWLKLWLKLYENLPTSSYINLALKEVIYGSGSCWTAKKKKQKFLKLANNVYDWYHHESCKLLIDGLSCLLNRYFFSLKPLVLKVGDDNIMCVHVFFSIVIFVVSRQSIYSIITDMSQRHYHKRAGKKGTKNHIHTNSNDRSICSGNIVTKFWLSTQLISDLRLSLVLTSKIKDSIFLFLPSFITWCIHGIFFCSLF